MVSCVDTCDFHTAQDQNTMGNLKSHIQLGEQRRLGGRGYFARAQQLQNEVDLVFALINEIKIWDHLLLQKTIIQSNSRARRLSTKFAKCYMNQTQWVVLLKIQSSCHNKEPVCNNFLNLQRKRNLSRKFHWNGLSEAEIKININK